MAQFRTDIKKFSTSHDVTRHEVFFLSDRLTPSGTATDAFGRLRISTPFTLFDSSHRYQDNGLWSTSNTSGNSTFAHVQNQSLIAMTLTTDINAEIIRETNRVFVYQPGKSLLIMNTFAMETPKTNLRQRVGYFGADNGIYLENDGTTNYFVLRTNTSSTISETRVAQSNWNIDKFDGTGYSSQGVGAEHGALNVARTNILWTDVEWLGVGDVRCGFVVDGKLVTAHIFHNDNVNLVPYMTTAILPIRYEIKNTGITSSGSTLKQICSTVISEGGYQLFGTQRTAHSLVTTPQTAATAGTFVPLVSIRLKSNRLDAVAIISAINILGIGNVSRIQWAIFKNCSLTGASWVSAATDSSVEYDITATALSGGVKMKTGFSSVTNQSSSTVDILKEALFRFQLERNSFTSTPLILTLGFTGATNGDQAIGSIDWEEIG
ncbi:MAG: hypothetical protein EBU90_21730 [Proteobacteria bacterium]|nr:hypothetical protein [Pseudomonadota bacterium]